MRTAVHDGELGIEELHDIISDDKKLYDVMVPPKAKGSPRKKPQKNAIRAGQKGGMAEACEMSDHDAVATL